MNLKDKYIIEMDGIKYYHQDIKQAVVNFESQLNADLSLCKNSNDLMEFIEQLQINYKSEFGEWDNEN